MAGCSAPWVPSTMARGTAVAESRSAGTALPLTGIERPVGVTPRRWVGVRQETCQTFMVSGSAIPPPLVEHARGSQAGARTAIDGAALTAGTCAIHFAGCGRQYSGALGQATTSAPLSSLTSPAAGTRSRPPLDDFQPGPDLPLAPPGKSECSHERRSEPVRVPPLVIRISGTGVRCVSDAVLVDGYMRRPGEGPNG